MFWQAAIHSQKSKNVKKCGLGCGGNNADCVVLCGRPDGKGHAALPVKSFKQLIRLTSQAVAVMLSINKQTNYQMLIVSLELSDIQSFSLNATDPLTTRPQPTTNPILSSSRREILFDVSLFQSHGKAFGLAKDDVTLLQSALRQQVCTLIYSCNLE